MPKLFLAVCFSICLFALPAFAESTVTMEPAKNHSSTEAPSPTQKEKLQVNIRIFSSVNKDISLIALSEALKEARDFIKKLDPLSVISVAPTYTCRTLSSTSKSNCSATILVTYLAKIPAVAQTEPAKITEPAGELQKEITETK